METYRADIGAANDNRLRRRRNWIMIALLILALLAMGGYVQARSYFFKGLPELPDKAAMWELNLQPTITLLDKDGRVIGHRGPHLGRPLKLSELPQYVPNAFLAIEDERFYSHTGIDRKAIFRAFFENTKAGKTVQGGSTLTQQLVKNMVLTREKTYRRKFQEMWLSYEMEKVLTKPEILELYLNRIELGNRSFGIEAAARRYFDKTATQLTLSEAAMLAGLPKAPSRYDPTKNYELAWARAKLVLQRMLTNNMITAIELSEAETSPPKIKEPENNLINPDLIGHAFDMISERSTELVGSKNRDLIVRTTLDPDMQNAAHKSLTDVLSRSGKARKISEGAITSIDTKTGAVRALIGGKDYADSKFNRAAQAKRQPGSSFKAFVYAAALENGFSPGTVRFDQPINIGGWSPENYTLRYRGPMTLREALKLSINTIAAQVSAEVGPAKVAEIGRRFGLTTEMRPTFSIALGSSEVTLVDLTGAYMVFANEGMKRTPYMIESIRNTAGKTLYRRKDKPAERVYAKSYAQQMTSILNDVINTGTGHGARLGTRQAAGKTGTSQDYRDAWFIGFTAQYVTGVWMGNDDNSPMAKVTGGLHPVDAWKSFMLKAHRNVKTMPLISEDPLVQDASKQELIAFYQDLTEEFISERNAANGLTSSAPLQSVNLSRN